MNRLEPSNLFNEFYYAQGCGEPYERNKIWLNLFASFAERIEKEISPSSVLDAGCAMGFLVEKLREKGIDAWGVDISPYAISQVAPEIKDYCWEGTVTEPFPRRYDLIVCIEVLEHLPRDESEKAVANLCAHSEDVLFSSTPYDYKESSHFNVQPVEYWAELFAKDGFVRDVDFNASFITPWAVRFRKSSQPVQRMIRDYERKYWFLWKENVDLRDQNLELQRQLAEHDQQSQVRAGSGLGDWMKRIINR